ncbi:MAG: hypothetical protein PUP91_20255 [Rhizonema sp. PD37]|nr:hypothetical protein [Rhizonema sp. PD37]
MFFRYSNFTSCIRSGNLAAIEQGITRLLEQEAGCHRLTELPQLMIDVEQLRRRPPCLPSNLWLFGLFGGTNGWTIVKSWPYELLCQRATGVSRPWLSALAIQLRCDAFHLRASRSFDGVLLEADATGRTFISGCIGSKEAPECYQFYEEQIYRPLEIAQFSLLEVPHEMQAALRVNENPEVQRIEAEIKKLKGDEEDLPSELMDELGKTYIQRIDQALAAVMAGSHNYWNLYNLAYCAYAKPQWLEAVGAKLLYFQPPSAYVPSSP